MTTSNIQNGSDGRASHTPFEPKGSEKDAAAWANLLDDWLGPENDVYIRLLQRPQAEKQKTRQ